MTRSARLRFIAVAVYTLVIGCASGGSHGTASTPRIQPPTMLSTTRPDWRLPTVSPPDGRVLDISLEIQVGATGIPDVRTLQLSGIGAEDDRDVLVAWLQTARFRPAQQGGQPVAGMYKARYEVRATVRRVG